MTVPEMRTDRVSTPTLPIPEEVGTERGTSGRQRVFATNTGYLVRLGISAYTARQRGEIFNFILGNLDEEERGWFTDDLAKAVVQAWQTHSFESLGRVLASWEETVEIKLNPELSRALDEAFDEADEARKAQGR